MALRGGQILHVGNGVTVIDRLQVAGSGDLNIPTEKIYELGNYESVATIRDVPDISFNMESLDVSCEMEALLTDKPLATTDAFELTAVRSLNITSPIKAGKDKTNPYSIIASVGLPGLMPESISYNFGLRDNARQTVTLRGDSIFYAPGMVKVEKIDAGADALTTASPSGIYRGSNGPTRILAVVQGNSKLTEGPDYTVPPVGTDAYTAVTVTLAKPVPTGEVAYVMYFTNEAHEMPQSVHETVAVKPAAVRGRDIDIYFGAIQPQNKVTGVQSFTLDWRAMIDRDEEFGNYYATSVGFDVPSASGSIEILPRDVPDLMRRIRQVSGVTNPDEAIGPNLAAPTPVHAVIKDPNNGGQVIKVLSVDAARFIVPGYTGRANEKLPVTLNWEDDLGKVVVRKAIP